MRQVGIVECDERDRRDRGPDTGARRVQGAAAAVGTGPPKQRTLSRPMFQIDTAVATNVRMVSTAQSSGAPTGCGSSRLTNSEQIDGLTTHIRSMRPAIVPRSLKYHVRVS